MSILDVYFKGGTVMNSTENETRRSFLRKFAAGTMLAVAGISARPRNTEAGEIKKTGRDNEIIYTETDQFRDYYRSLRA